MPHSSIVRYIKHLVFLLLFCLIFASCNRKGCPAFEKGSFDRGVPELKEKRKFKSESGLGFDQKRVGSRKKSLSKQKKSKKKKKFK